MNKFLKFLYIFSLIIILLFSTTACDSNIVLNDSNSSNNLINDINSSSGNVVLRASNFSGSPYIAINDNIPYFTDEEKTNTKSFETYSKLDNLGRCGVAFANISKDLMPTEDRESLSSVTPTGWNNKKYDFVDGGWLYNRAHIIGFQLAGEQANELNLITGTRYFNVDGMLTFENMVADYIKETNNHVLYRVTPIFEGNNLVCEGVTMEAWSVEDNGEGICFNVFCYNVQDGVTIDYKTGNNWESSTKPSTDNTNNEKYILNENSKKFHKTTCSSINSISDKNKKEFTGSRDDLIKNNYEPCGSCKP